jgi:hypothetical protein
MASDVLIDNNLLTIDYTDAALSASLVRATPGSRPEMAISTIDEM